MRDTFFLQCGGIGMGCHNEVCKLKTVIFFLLSKDEEQMRNGSEIEEKDAAMPRNK